MNASILEEVIGTIVEQLVLTLMTFLLTVLSLMTFAPIRSI